jgi:hypothetical protein
MKLCIELMTNSHQAYTKSDLKFQISSDLTLMTISLQTQTKTPYKHKLATKNFPSGQTTPFTILTKPNHCVYSNATEL